MTTVGDTRNREAVLRQADPTLRAIARKYVSWRHPIEDLMQEMRVAVWQAIPDWRQGQGASILTYCINRAKGHAQHFVRDTGYLIRTPANVIERGGERYDPIWINEHEGALDWTFGGCDFAPFLIDALTENGHKKTQVIEKTVSLTERESDYLDRLCKGMTSVEIAAELGIEPRSVTSQLCRIYRKLGVNNAIQCYNEAIRRGLVVPPRREI